MPAHDYTPREALDLLLKKMQERFPSLYDRMKDAIDAGRDVQEKESDTRPRGRTYRKNVPYTDPEALVVALEVLESHLIESRKLIDAANTEFTKVFVAPAKPAEAKGQDAKDLGGEEVRNKDEAKTIEIEVEPETVLEKVNRPNVSLKSTASAELEQLESLFQELKKLIDFTEETHGNAR